MSTKIYQLSSLAKVFPDKIYGNESEGRTVFKGQTASFQIAVIGTGDYTFDIESELSPYMSVYKVGYVPSGMAAYPQSHDDNYLTLEGGMFPDPLFPKKDKMISLTDGEFYTLWINFRLPKDIEAKKYPTVFSLFKDGAKVDGKVFTLDVKNEALGDMEIVFTQWFHSDCIADVHGVEVFSEEHWTLIEKYIKKRPIHLQQYRSWKN